MNETTPVITSNGGGTTGSIQIAENGRSVTTVVATDTDTGDELAYSIVGGADAALFEIDEVTGALRFVDPPDFENASDADQDNILCGPCCGVRRDIQRQPDPAGVRRQRNPWVHDHWHGRRRHDRPRVHHAWTTTDTDENDVLRALG